MENAANSMGRIKGSHVLGTVKGLRSFREQALQLLPADLHHYLDDRVLVSGWYPEVDYGLLLKALAKLMQKRVSGDVWEFLGETGATSDAQGMYAMLVRENDPGGTLLRAEKAWPLIHDTGRMEVDLFDPKRANIEIRDYTAIEPEFASLIAGYYRGLVRAAGALKPECRVLVCRDAHEGPTVIEVSWR